MRLSIGVAITIILLATASVSVFSVREYSAGLSSLIAAQDRSADDRELEPLSDHHAGAVRIGSMPVGGPGPNSASASSDWISTGTKLPPRLFRRPPSQSSKPATETTNKPDALHPTFVPRRD